MVNCTHEVILVSIYGKLYPNCYHIITINDDIRSNDEGRLPTFTIKINHSLLVNIHNRPMDPMDY